jgi:hypothetical protein
MTRKHKSSIKKVSSRNDGSALESLTLEIMRLFPGASLESQKKLAGKKVDNYCVLSTGFMPPFRIAIECKDWGRPLTRKQVAVIVSEYLSLLDQELIDQFLLVTRHGIVPDARNVFDGRKLQHFTFADLTDKVLDPTPLIDNMVRQYSAGGLDKYYIPQWTYAPDLEVASSDFDLLYNEFIDFAVESAIDDLNTAKEEWRRYNGDNLKQLVDRYYQASFYKILAQRRNEVLQQLETLVLEWVNNDSIQQGLALLGSYGTGKSSFAKRLAFAVASSYRRDKVGRIPLLIELKEFGSHQDISGLITHELVNRHRVLNGSFELFQSLNAAGRILLILDGFDEMKQGMTIDSLIYNFHQISSLHNARSKILLCGRPTIFENQAEQTRVFKGDLQLGTTSLAQYIQINLAPFDTNEVGEFLLRYSMVHNKTHLERIKLFIEELATEVRINKELASLVSRPVHLPMLVSVIPRLNLSPKLIRRSDLYKEFIDAIIEREMLKRHAEFRVSYSIESRRRFAVGLAFEMCRKGESRSLRTTEIPDHLLEGFVRPGYPKEAVRRDLVAACFLERKPPDILFVPHKSFLEYLAAEHIVGLMREDSPNTDALGFEASPEILSFVLEMASDEDWKNVLRHWTGNIQLLQRWMKDVTLLKRKMSKVIETEFLERYWTFSNSFRAEIIDYYENGAPVLSNVAKKLLLNALQDSSSVAAVHAYRALRRHGEVLTIKELHQRLGASRLAYWGQVGWLSLNENEAAVLKKILIGQVAGMLFQPLAQLLKLFTIVSEPKR